REERSLQVIVAAGRVALRRTEGADSLLLRPRDRGVIDAGGTVTIISGVSLKHYLAWIRGTLQFDDAPLGGVLAQLERWYDLEIQTTDRSLERERRRPARRRPSCSTPIRCRRSRPWTVQ